VTLPLIGVAIVTAKHQHAQLTGANLAVVVLILLLASAAGYAVRRRLRQIWD
jgi:hypothetical protein